MGSDLGGRAPHRQHLGGRVVQKGRDRAALVARQVVGVRILRGPHGAWGRALVHACIRGACCVFAWALHAETDSGTIMRLQFAADPRRRRTRCSGGAIAPAIVATTNALRWSVIDAVNQVCCWAIAFAIAWGGPQRADVAATAAAAASAAARQLGVPCASDRRHMKEYRSVRARSAMNHCYLCPFCREPRSFSSS
jgi:hypothetical protein